MLQFNSLALRRVSVLETVAADKCKHSLAGEGASVFPFQELDGQWVTFVQKQSEQKGERDNDLRGREALRCLTVRPLSSAAHNPPQS